MHLSTKEIVVEIERRARKANISISEISRRANLARSTFQRWKAGEGEASLTSLNKIYRVLAEAESSKA